MKAVCRLATLAALAGPTAAFAEPVTIPKTEQFDLTSKAGLAYRVFVAVPSGPAPAAGYPVIYLSDGNGNFPTVVAAARRQRLDGPAVVVGVGYPSDDPAVHDARRVYDLTPPTPATFFDNPPMKAKRAAPRTGGQDEFLAFIEDEVKPAVGKKYRIDRGRQALFGHSLGGLLVLHALFARPAAYQVYLASSPSIWWNDRAVLAEEKAFRAKPPAAGWSARLLVTVGEWEKEGGPREPRDRAALLAGQRMVAEARELADRLTAGAVPGLAVTFRAFPEEDHGSVVLPAASRAVRLALTPPAADRPPGG